MAILLGSAYGKVHIDSSGVRSGVNSAKQSIGSLGDSAVQLGAKLQSVGRSLTATFTLPVALLGGKAFQVMKDFDGSLNLLKAVANATNEEMEEMTALARQLGADLTLPGTSAADAAEAMAELAKAGLNVNQIMSAARGVLQLSAAGQIDNARAAEITANALNAFHLEGEDAVKIADLLAASANSSSAEVHEMADSLQMSAAVMAMSNMTIEETVAALGLLANAGIQGSDAGTSLKQMFLALQTPSNNQKDVMQQYGLSIYNAAGNMKSMREIIVEFSSKLSGLNDEQRNYALGVLFGSDAVRAANIVLMQGADAYDQMFASVTKAGEASRLAAALMEGLPGVIENIKSSFETAAIAAIEPFKDEIIAVGNAVAKALNWFSNLPEPVRKVIVVIVLFLAVLGPLLFLLGSIVPVLGLATRSLNPFSGGIIGLIFSFVKLVAAAAIVVKVLTFLGISTGPAGAAILGLNGAIAGTASTIWGALLPAIGALFAALIPVLAILAGLALWVGIVYLAWRMNFLGMRDNIVVFVVIVKNLWKAFTAFLRGDTDAALKYLTEAFDAFGARFNQIFEKIFGIKDAWGKFLEWMRGALGRTISFISDSFTKMDWSQVGRFIIMGIANGIMMGIPGLLLAATKAAESVLKAFDDKLDMHSPSKAMEKRGQWSWMGYMQGWNQPQDIAQMMTKPLLNTSNSQQQNITMQFANGLTMRQVRGMIDDNNEQIMSTIIGALGGA